MNSWHSYPSIYNLGHRYVESLLTVPVNVEEKVDGSQFSFGVTKDGEIKIRSKGAQMYIEAPERMFSAAADSVRSLADRLHRGWTYRGEFLAKPKHNTLCYSRVPRLHIILFDICTGEESYLSYEDKAAEAKRLGMECVPLLFHGAPTLETIRTLLQSESVLGGQLIEGVVIKPAAYDLFGQDKKVLMGKFVSEAFKEVHSGSWRESNPTKTDVIERLAEQYATPARWNKAVMHLRERGQITDSPKDIGTLLREVVLDIEGDSTEEIKQKLYDFAWPQVRRMVTRGLPEWYKEQLLKRQFEDHGGSR